MFFAETLGPALTTASGDALFAYLRNKLGPATTGEALRAAAGDFLRLDGSRVGVDQALLYLLRRGLIARQNDTTFRIIDPRRDAA